MNAWLEAGIPLMLWIQGLGDFLQVPMQFFTFLGTENFFLIVMPALFWCVDVGLGIRVGLILLTSTSLNASFKLIFGGPRPTWVSTLVAAHSHESSFGMPSGHAQNALAMWGLIGVKLKKRWVTWVVVILIAGIAVSRLYLGVHFPADTLAGLLAGALILVAFLTLERPVIAWFKRQAMGTQIAGVLAYSLVLLGLGLLMAAITDGRAVPPAWVATAQAAVPGSEPINPRDLGGLVASTGVIFGLGAGVVLLMRWGHFDAGGPLGKRFSRYVIGLSGVIIIYLGLRLVLPRGDTLIPQALRFLRYAAVGFWVSYLGPRVFVMLKLASNPSHLE
jgi:membrane-associated phospholipid phosphatase